MVIKTLKRILPSFSGSEHADFKKILDSFPKQYILTDDDISLLFKAFELGSKAHSNQKRKSGEKYFNHCIEVANQLIKWNMDLSTIISGLLHDTIEDTEITKENLSKEF